MKTLIVKAFTGSEWDNVDFFAVELTEVMLTLLKKAKEESLRLSEIFDTDYSHIALYLGGDFKMNNEDEDMLMLESQEDYKIVDNFDPDEYVSPENKLDYAWAKFDRYGCVKFVDLGEHTGEEFWTESINVDKILEL